MVFHHISKQVTKTTMTLSFWPLIIILNKRMLYIECSPVQHCWPCVHMSWLLFKLLSLSLPTPKTWVKEMWQGQICYLVRMSWLFFLWLIYSPGIHTLMENEFILSHSSGIVVLHGQRVLATGSWGSWSSYICEKGKGICHHEKRKGVWAQFNPFCTVQRVSTWVIVYCLTSVKLTHIPWACSKANIIK